MNLVRDAILPLVLIGLLGWFLRRLGLLGPERRSALEVLIYWVLLPALLTTRLARSDFDPALLGSLAAGVVLPVLATAAALVALRRLVAPAWLAADAFPAVLQGAIRNNTLVSLALGEAVLGERGAVYAALAVMLNVPLANLLSVGALLRARAAASGGPRQATLRAMLRNPLFVAIAVGIALGASGAPVPRELLRAGAMLAQAVLPLALLVVGAAVTLPTIAGRRTALGVAVLLKLVVVPLLAWATLRLFAVGSELTLALVLFHAAPTATAAYVLTRQLGGDAQLMAAITSVQTVLAAVTLPVLILLLPTL